MVASNSSHFEISLRRKVSVDFLALFGRPLTRSFCVESRLCLHGVRAQMILGLPYTNPHCSNLIWI